MTNPTISISFNGSPRSIPTELIPVVDDPMRALLGELVKDTPPPASLTSLAGKIKDLTNLNELLTSAMDSPNRDKIFGVLPTAVLAALVGGIALSFMFNAVAGVVMLVLGLGFLLFCHSIATWVGQSDK